MTSKGPVVKIGKEHSQRETLVTGDVFSVIPSRIRVPPRLQRMGKSARSNTEKGKIERARDNKESWTEKKNETGDGEKRKVKGKDDKTSYVKT